MKKRITVLLAVLLLLCFSGCSSNQNEPVKEEETVTEKTEEKEETPAPEESEKEESSSGQPLSLSAVYDYSFPEDWKEIEPFVFEAADGNVYIYLYLLPKRPDGIDIVPAGMKVTDNGFADVWKQYVEMMYGVTAEYSALPGYADRSGGGVDYFHTMMTFSNDQERSNELLDVYDYNEDVFLLMEYVYGIMMAGKASDCSNAFNETLGYTK